MVKGTRRHKFQVNDRVRVVKNTSDHDFPVGSVVQIIELCTSPTESYYATDGADEGWWLLEEEIEAVK